MKHETAIGTETSQLAPDDYDGMYAIYSTLLDDNQPMIQYKIMRGKTTQDIIKWHLKREARKKKATERVVESVKPIDESLGKFAARLDAWFSGQGGDGSGSVNTTKQK